MKNVLFLFILIFSLVSCQTTETKKPDVETPSATTEYSLIGGKTMGTTYSVKYQGANTKVINGELDSLFVEINNAVSTYIKTSVISDFNRDEKEWEGNEEQKVLNEHFLTNYKKSEEVFKITEGLFDPTVMPIVNYWGFGYTGKEPITKVDEKKVKGILEYVGMEKLAFQASQDKGKISMGIRKANPKVQLDFGAIAKGYAVDKAAEYLDGKNIHNYLVEIGGEVRTKGLNPNGKNWLIGVNTPEEESKINDFMAYVNLSDKGMATSGNYRNFYEVDGEKYSHTINPKTGFPERSNLLSATIIADDCMTADAYATACMVGGLEKAMNWIKNDKNLEGYFIFADKNGNLQSQASEGFKKYLKE